MFAVGRVPLSYKPALNQGAGSDLVFKIRILVGNVSNIELKVDNSVVLATREWSEKTFQKLTDAIDAYSKTQSDDKFLEKTQANLFIQKDKFNAYTNEAPLPAGDMNSKDYWVKIKPGFYWFNSVGNGYINKPADAGHFLVLRHTGSSDLQVLCFEHPSHRIFHFWSNGNSSGGWADIDKSLGVGQEYKNLIGQRRANEIYTNDTGRPIYVNIGIKANGPGERNLKINGVIVDTAAIGAAQQLPNTLLVKGIVPSGATYSVEGSVNFWFELR